MISTTEIQPHIVAHTLAKYLSKDYKLDIPKQELMEYIRTILWAMEKKNIILDKLLVMSRYD